MSETCIWRGSDQPRAVKGKHLAACTVDEQGPLLARVNLGPNSFAPAIPLGQCAGCLPCPKRHCCVDGHEHLDSAHPLTCPSCVGEVRKDLQLIVDMHAKLPSEAVNRGWNGDRDGQVLGGDAMVMLAMTYREQTGVAADGDHSHERKSDPVPPLLTLATWEDVWRDHLGHDPAGTASVRAAAVYLGLLLTQMAQDPDVPFEDFARDIRQTRGRMQSVLHDRNLGDVANIGCFECGDRLERRLTDDGFEDVWTCQRCRRRYTYTEYNFALRAHLEAATEKESA